MVLAVLPVLPGLSDELQDVDPPQYADVAARILRSGQWLELTDMYGPFQNKPPLMMWAQAVSMGVLGVDSLGARLPALLFGLLAVLATFLIGRELGRGEGLGEELSAERGLALGSLGGAFFGASVAFHLMVADPKVDMPLTALTALAVWAVLAARRRPAWIWLAWASCGLAVLSKGPIGLALPVLALLPEVFRAGWTEQRESMVRRVLRLKPVRGLLLVAVIVAPFYVGAARHGGSEAIGFHLWKQGLGRITGASEWVNNTTPLFFTHTMLWALLPFSPLLLSSLVRRSVGVWRARGLPSRPGRVLVWWFVTGLVVISIVRYRLPQYVFWLGPPAALLAAEELLTLSPRAAARWRAVFAVIAVLAAALGVGLLVLGFPSSVELTIAWGAALVGLPMAAWALARGLEEPWRVGASVIAGVAPFLLFFHGYLHPALLEYQPGREMGLLARQEDPQGTLVPHLDPLWPTCSVAFYGRRDAAMMSADAMVEVVRSRRSRLVAASPGDEQALESAGLRIERSWTFKSFPTSVPKGRFLLARTREATLSTIVVHEVSAP